MRYLRMVVAMCSAINIYVEAYAQIYAGDTKSIRHLLDFDREASKSRLSRRGIAFKKRPQEESSQARKSRLNAQTPTSETLARAKSGGTSWSNTRNPSSGQVTVSGPLTTSWSRTADQAKIDHSPLNRQYTSIRHSQGSAVGGESYRTDGHVATSVEGRRVESNIKVGKDSRAEMRINLDGLVLHGNIGENSPAHVKFRHPDPNGKFEIATELLGKGYLGSQGQAHLGSSDVSDHDVKPQTAVNRSPQQRSQIQGSSPQSSRGSLDHETTSLIRS